jgi:hypothetical protein
MTLVVRPLPLLPAANFSLRPLLRWLAGRDAAPALPNDMEDWQLRDLALTRPVAGPCRPLFFELP